MPEKKDGAHILQGASPNFEASESVIFSDTFFTILQLAKWYFAPEGVL